MKNILLINGHQPFPSSPGKLNGSFVAQARAYFETLGWPLRLVETAKAWTIEEEVENQLWADLILLQFPLNSMGLPWPLKRYLDEVYTAGMDGRLAKGDGRSRSDPEKQYGSGGAMHGRSYLLSVTLNAPLTAFSDPEQALFEGRSLDQLLAPVHINFAFFGLKAEPTFAAYDINKAPEIDKDFARFSATLTTLSKELLDRNDA
ncbi:MAG: NAD(P)H-dependent oxidoreductase [Roseobacter sp.]|uniref:NAD(P)H-dependent oxidoreductase n=1 Tax=Parasphingorhabdus sp. TaxID=2709688 RepID=UPI0032642124